MLELREHQLAVVDKLKQGFLEGHRCQLLYAPTGFGKTEVAMSIMKRVADGFKKTAMVLDRIVLVEQTSLRLGKYDIDHGVMQAGHWRYRPAHRIQICSAQTLEKRKSFPEIDLLIVDECHVQRTKTTQFIKDNPQIRVIGLTATPFTKGLGSTYTNVVGAASTGELIEKKWLCPLRVFIAKEINMEGAKKVAGEWSQDEVSKRGMEITGDVVSEWVKKTHEVFGGPRKTIVFCSGVDHGRDLQQQFAESGYKFISISYKEDDEYKRTVIEDFSRPDTDIVGLIATDILTRGFDVTDVMIGVSARPFSKSFSSHVQQLGRVMRPHQGKEFGLWLCLAKGSRVLTDKGLVPIDKVTLSHKIWDGTNFVNHGGAICNGIQKVIMYQGLTATEGHLVHTQEGWRTFGDCAREQIRITQTGFGGTAIRIGEDIRSTSFLAGRKAQTFYSCLVRMCNLRLQKLNFFTKLTGRENKGMQGLQSAGAGVSDVAIQQSSGDASQMLFKIKRSIRSLWRKRSGVQVFRSQARNCLDYGQSWFARIFFNNRSFAHTVGSDRPIWALRTRKFAMAFGGIKSTKQERQPVRCTNAQVSHEPSRNSLFRQHIEAFLLGWHDGREHHRKIQATFDQAEREVWDILDAGQHNRFTCEGLLVHNCHSGNYLRFREDWDELFTDGVKTLKEGGEKAKNEPPEKVKKESKCPKCQALWVWPDDKCGGCGFIRVRMSSVVSKPGQLEELQAANQKLQVDKQSFYSQILFYARARGFKDGWAAHKYKEKFGVWPRGLTEKSEMPTPATVSWIKSRAIAFAKSKARAA